jgi:hypothetical protein
MGTRGPVPKREAERRRTNEPTVPVEHVDVDVLEAIEVKTPEPDEHWHPVVRQLWDSFLESGQRFVLEPTDWALLFLACEDLTRELKPRKVNLGLDGRGEPILVEVAMPIPGGKLQARHRSSPERSRCRRIRSRRSGRSGWASRHEHSGDGAGCRLG